MNNEVLMIKYINDKRIFSITAFMAEFKLSYTEAVDFLYQYKESGNIKQLNDFNYQLIRSIFIEEVKKKEDLKKKEMTSPDDTCKSIDDILREINDELAEDSNDIDDFDSDDFARKLFEEADDSDSYEGIEKMVYEKPYEFKALGIITKIISLPSIITRQDAIAKAEEMQGMFELLEDSEMISIMNKVIEELKKCDDNDFDEIKKSINNGES